MITGASEGIGACLAEEVVKRGGKPILLARNETKLKEVKENLSKISKDVYIYPVDCSDFEAVEQTSKKILKEVGSPFVIINNAGAGTWKYLHEMNKEEISTCLNGNMIIFLIYSSLFSFYLYYQSFFTFNA